ncbi:DUF6455 family protein [Solirhodobacter olei]|uniref:DUF6455 family protein n=1 Tax=Solirhodobacter olei TaxID=2493082 RepID=UPI000FD9D25D|nr:DUF6455 family protein [Solirhodobacter olei]
MRDDGDLTVIRPFWLARGMARALGFSLAEALSTGALSREGLEAMMRDCGACPRQAECLDWLGRTTGRAEHLPEFCACRAPLEGARKRMPRRSRLMPATAF